MIKQKEKEDFIKERNIIIRKTLKKYKDFPMFLHEKNGNGTSGSLVIDEIVLLTINKLKIVLEEKKHE